MGLKKITEQEVATERGDGLYVLVTQQGEDGQGNPIQVLRRMPDEVLLGDIEKAIDDLQEGLKNVSIDPDDLGLEQDPETNFVYPTYKNVRSENGIYIAGGGGGGGGGGGNNAILTVENTSGWISKTVSVGASCQIVLTWSSLEDGMPTGDGAITVTVDGMLKRSQGISQGRISIDVSSYLKAGTSKVKVRISDVYDNSRTITFTVTVVELSISSNFDTSGIFSAGVAIDYTYTPVGAAEKTVHFVVDGTEVGTSVVESSGRQQTYALPAMTHGDHTLRVWFTATVDEETVSSNELYYDLIVVSPESTVPIIVSTFQATEAAQYETIAIPYRVYTPNSLNSEVSLKVDGATVRTLSVDRTEQYWRYRPDDPGEVSLKIVSGNVEKSFTLTVNESEIHVQPETDALVLYLTSQGRSNSESTRSIWEDADNHIHATLSGFNFRSDGWIADKDGITALRVSGDARVTIPYKPFERDFRGTGKTIEIEFASRSILNYDAVLISCMNNGRGFQLTAQNATLTSESSSIGVQYKEDEHVRVSFVAEKRAENRLLYVYINGIMSGVVQYPDNDDFSQLVPATISIGSNDATTDIYNIRVYDNNLTRYQILDNWIADTQDIDTLIARFEHNNVYDEYGTVTIDKLPNDLPYMVISCPELPQYKGDKKTVSVQYVDPVTASRSFTADGVQINVQGTSSAPYARKNYDMQYKNGFEMADGSHSDNYELAPGTVPFNRFVIKADVASSESANNVELVKLFCDATPFKRREQVADPRVRQGIYGFPIVTFWHNTANDAVTMLGKYNFNFPKRAPGPYGYSGDMESWEFQNNTSDLMLFKTDYFDETMVEDPSTGESKEKWRYDYEARFPSDEWTNYAKLQELHTFILSTYRDQATGDDLPETYVDDKGNEYTVDNAAYRLAKFRTEFGNYAEIDSFIFYYIFTELFLMVDSRAKNLFIGFSGSDADSTICHAIDRKAVAEPYDMDTAIGTNNEGSLVFNYRLEDTDHLTGGANVFNGQDSVLWCNLRDAFPTEITQMYQNLRSRGVLSYPVVEQRFEDHQAKWPEAIFNEDAQYKYLDPLVSPDPGKAPTAVYLPMLQGSKEEQRKWWLYNRFRYMDSKWNAGDALSDVIQLRGYAKDNITVTPYADIYPTVKYGSYLVSERGERGVPTTLVCPLDTVNDTEIYVYSASQLSHVGDLSGLKVGLADFSKATRLQSIKVGSNASGYTNERLEDLRVGTNTLLASVDARNCTALATAVDLSGCTNIEHVYFGGTAITSCDLPNGGILKTLQLPGTVTNLTVRNQASLTTFSMPSYANITTLRVENTPAIPVVTILNAIPANSRVRVLGLSLAVSTTAEVDALYDKLDTMRGLDESGGNVDHAVVTGSITGLTGVNAAWLADKQARYPEIDISYEYLTATLNYYNYDGSELLYVEEVMPGGDGEYDGQPTRENTAQYNYSFAGWALTMDATTADANATKNVTGIRNVYAAYSRFIRTYTVTWKNDNGTTLEADLGVVYGTMPTYNGSEPTSGVNPQMTFLGWSPAIVPVESDVTYTAVFAMTYTVNFYNGNTLLQQVLKVPEGGTAVYTGEEPTSSEEGLVFDGWLPEPTNIMANTNCYAQFRDTNTPLRQYLSGTMKEFHSNTVTKIATHSFQARVALKSVEASATVVESNAFDNCPALEEVDLTNTSPVTLNSSAFNGNKLLTHLIIRSETISSLSNVSALQGTKIETGLGAIYVPSGLVSTYKAATNWSTYAGQIFPISEYPKTDFSSIADTWDEIIANENYATDYQLGDTKLLEVNGVQTYMQLVGINADDKSDNSGKARMTWISKGAIMYRAMNESQKTVDGTTAWTAGGWSETDIREYLRETVLPTLPANIRNAIVEVTKTYRVKSPTDETKTIADTVWIPSYRELNLTTENKVESSGVVYSEFFSSNNSRKKYNTNGVVITWWLRTAYSGSDFIDINSYFGSDSHDAANYPSPGIAIGFCI